jgi:hypothetical protein
VRAQLATVSFLFAICGICVATVSFILLTFNFLDPNYCIGSFDAFFQCAIRIAQIAWMVRTPAGLAFCVSVVWVWIGLTVLTFAEFRRNNVRIALLLSVCSSVWLLLATAAFNQMYLDVRTASVGRLSAPSEVLEGEIADVGLRIYAEALRQPGVASHGPRRTPPYVRFAATLTGIGFAIDPTGLQQREYRRDENLNWAWKGVAEKNRDDTTYFGPMKRQRGITVVLQAQTENSKDWVYLDTFTAKIYIASTISALWERGIATLQSFGLIVALLIQPIIVFGIFLYRKYRKTNIAGET